MSDQVRAIPQPEKPEQVERAKQLREAIENAKRGVPGPKTPRSVTDQAAAEAARKAQLGSR
jgi:hypothetical protein